jgi:nucleoside-diphosphate-sugar epimerase
LGKIASELRVWAAQAAGLSISIVRPGVILGMGPKANAPQELWARILDGKLPLTTDGSTGVVDVRDVASMVVKAHTHKVEGPLVAVAENVLFYELVEGMGAAIGARKKIKRLNANPWLERMRFLGFLSHVPVVGRFFTPQMRIMLFSRVKYDGTSGGAVHPYRPLDQTLDDFGAFLQKVWK